MNQPLPPRQVRSLFGPSHPLRCPQRFYPQCQRCSIRQAVAMRRGRRTLVLHMHVPRHRLEHLAGGLRFGGPLEGGVSLAS
jgi:hypothetical protein